MTELRDRRRRIAELLREKRRTATRKLLGIAAARQMGIVFPTGIPDEDIESVVVAFKPNEKPTVSIVYKISKRGIKFALEQFGLVPLQDLLEAEMQAEEEIGDLGGGASE